MNLELAQEQDKSASQLHRFHSLALLSLSLSLSFTLLFTINFSKLKLVPVGKQGARKAGVKGKTTEAALYQELSRLE